MIARPVLRVKIPLRRAGLGVPEELKELQRGQIIVLFAASLMVFIGILGIAIDMSWVAVNEMRMQKAADAAALAGAVYLPPDPGTGSCGIWQLRG